MDLSGLAQIAVLGTARKYNMRLKQNIVFDNVATAEGNMQSSNAIFSFKSCILWFLAQHATHDAKGQYAMAVIIHHKKIIYVNLQLWLKN